MASIIYVGLIGLAAGWWLHEVTEPASVPQSISRSRPVDLPIETSPADRPAEAAPPPVATGHEHDGESIVAGAVLTADPIAELKRHHLVLPIAGSTVEHMKGGFAERRDGNRRAHEAVDILAPRNTPVLAVEDGTIARLFLSRNGGITIYQFDPTRRFCYYYAHLERYADGLREGETVSAGEVIGYVGTTGNAPPRTPHLHFAIFELNPDRRWWEGTPIDPYLVYSSRTLAQ
jgi:murein DD-endopeptidase MepM/ murein hydrolase activator NlpD